MEVTDARLMSRMERVKRGKSDKFKFEQDLKASLASLSLGRDFGETTEDFYARRPDIKKMADERVLLLQELAKF